MMARPACLRRVVRDGGSGHSDSEIKTAGCWVLLEIRGTNDQAGRTDSEIALW